MRLIGDELIVGHVGEWDLSSGDLIEHKVHDGAVYCIALRDDMIITSDGGVIRAFDITCLLLL